MRHALILLLLVPLAPGAQVIEDPAMDMQLHAGGEVVTSPTNGMDVDLAALHVEEALDFTFRLVLHPAPPGSIMDAGSRTIGFSFHGTPYEIRATHAAQPNAKLWRLDVVSGGATLVGDLDGDLPDDRTLDVTVPRDFILDADGASPAPGDTLEAFWADASALLDGRLGAPGTPVDGTRTALSDRMPDAGTAGEFQVTRGKVQSGDARLFSTQPSRASNGEASTFVFPLAATNLGSEARSYRIDAFDIPDTWIVDLPSVFVLDGQATRHMNAIVVTAFVHQHGGYDAMTLRMQDESDANSFSELTLRISYFQVPQPTGHHDTLWFHSRPANPEVPGVTSDDADRLWMDARESPPEDTQQRVAGPSQATVGSSSYRWMLDLEPALSMGLDFRDALGEISVPLTSSLPIPEAQFNASVYIGEDFRLVGYAEGTTSFGPGEQQTIDLPFHIVAPDIPYESTQRIVLIMGLAVGRPASWSEPEAVYLEPGGFLQLPLNEYRDPVPEFDQRSQWYLDGPASREAAPGSVLVFTPEATTQSVRLSANVAWAELLPSQGEVHPVVVRIPDSARDGDVADIVLTGTTDEGDMALRLLVFVRNAPLIDESNLAASFQPARHKDSPALPLAFLVLALLFARPRPTP